MPIGQLEKLLVRSEPAGGEPAELPETFACEERKRRQTTLGSAVRNWLRIRAVLNVCTGRRARRVLRRASGLLLVGWIAYLIFLELLNEVRPVRPRLHPAARAGARERVVPISEPVF